MALTARPNMERVINGSKPPSYTIGSNTVAARIQKVKFFLAALF